MSVIYRDLADCINKAKFKCHVYGGFMERIPLYFQRYPDRMPLYINPASDTIAELTISRMMDMFAKEETFTIHEPNDVLVIKAYIESYINSTRRFVEELPETDDLVIFISRCKAFLLVINEFAPNAEEQRGRKLGMPKNADRTIDVLQRLSRSM
jgi:hypothetical protein